MVTWLTGSDMPFLYSPNDPRWIVRGEVNQIHGYGVQYVDTKSIYQLSDPQKFPYQYSSKRKEGWYEFNLFSYESCELVSKFFSTKDSSVDNYCK